LLWLTDRLDRDVVHVALTAKELLDKAVEARDFAVIDVLVARGHQISSLSVELALLSGDLPFVARLIDAGASVEESGIFGTPLCCAVLRRDVSLIELLLKRGADINGGGCFGTPLMAAARENDREMVSLLLRLGADPAVVYDDDTASSVALRSGHRELAELLRSLSYSARREGA
jgi:ankyrin repeat protein